ncbi:MAG: type II toxin-antitoxin system RelE/ParE family toxin [Sphingobacteriales bacterium]|nr:type II toxin-antitoxin system RelE/ParE family toxin [Sphingobacteriales bacterium]
MEVRFRNIYLEKLFQGIEIKKKPLYSEETVIGFKKAIIKIAMADNSVQLRKLKSLHFEALKGNRQGQYSIRVNKKYRLIFTFEQTQIVISEVVMIEELSNHYK